MTSKHMTSAFMISINMTQIFMISTLNKYDTVYTTLVLCIYDLSICDFNTYDSVHATSVCMPSVLCIYDLKTCDFIIHNLSLHALSIMYIRP